MQVKCRFEQKELSGNDRTAPSGEPKIETERVVEVEVALATCAR